MGFDDAERVVF